MAKKPTVSKLKKKLDNIFSKFIRMRNAFYVDNELHCTCVTCGKTAPVKNMQNGHFMSRQHNSTRYDEENCNVQCYGCNVMQQGRQYEHGLYINEIHGSGTAEFLHQESKKLRQFKTFELEEMIEIYTEKVKELENSL